LFLLPVGFLEHFGRNSGAAVAAIVGREAGPGEEPRGRRPAETMLGTGRGPTGWRA